jgi:alkylation response protein AidB-like acyl-CoA dehydrogenase
MTTSLEPSFTAQQEAFRHEVRIWLEANTPSEPTPRDEVAQVAFLRAWQAKLSTQGYVATHWPVAYGGAGRGWTEHFIVQEELARARAPEIINRIAVNLVSPVLINHGTEEQRQKYLLRILRADDSWCQLFSEPGAGSDLRSLTTTATRAEGGWTVRGQKLWSSWAHHARYGVLLARTDGRTEGPPAIGYFLLDMDQPGVVARPVRQMTGDAEFCEVFLDDAFIPDENVIGSPTDGWRIVGATLNYERSLSPRQLITHANLLRELIDQARKQTLPAQQRQRLARAYSELHIYRLHLYRVLTMLERGEQPTATSSIVKLFWSEMAQRMHELSVDMLGPGLLSEPSDRQRAWLYYRSCTIFAGTSEIQRNTLGERVLGLPREPRPEPRSP